MRNFVARTLVLFAFALMALTQAKSQAVASITGLVTDPSGAVVPGVNVTLVNVLNGSIYKAVSTAEGSYLIVNVKPGPGYKISFERDGFKPATITDIYLLVSTTRTQNARMVVGGSSETVQVSAGNETVTINTTDATVGNNFDVSTVNDLPVQNRDSPVALFRLQPGITNNAVTGARTDQSNVTVDGLDVNDFATGQTFAIISRAPVDSVQEFRAEVAGDVSGVGTGGGGQFQLVTKSGTNSFHGNVNEYHRDTQLAANSWFNNNTVNPTTHLPLPRTPLIRNQFGGNIAGPVIKDKLFFFFDFNNSRIIQSSSANRTVPLDSFRNGNVSYILNQDSAGHTCAASSRQNTTPQCIGTLDAAGIAGKDPQHVGTDPNLLSFVNARYPHANDLTGGDGINTGGYRFNTPTPDLLYNYISKVDYTLNSSMKVYARYTVAREDATQTVILLPGDKDTHPFQDRSYSYVIGHNWTIGSNKVNQFAYGDTIAKYNFGATSFYPAGTSIFTFGGGAPGALTSGPYNSPSAQKRRVPIPMVRDDFSWIKGSHNFQFGGTFKFIKTNSNLLNDFNFVGVGLGGGLTNLTAPFRPSDIRTAGTTASNTYDNAFALALGRVGSIGSNYNYDNKGVAQKQGSGATRRYRYYETEVYFGDTWKLNPSLTVSYGARYQYYSVPYETQGRETIQNFSFDKYFAARAKQSAAGISGDSSLPFISYTLGGKANTNGAPLYQPSWKDISPRVSFAYNPANDKKLVIRAGAGIMFDRTVIGAVNFIQDQSSYLFQNSASKQYGSTDPTASLLTDPRLGANLAIPAPPAANAISNPYTPYVDGGTPHGLADQEFNTAIDPTLKDPYSIMYGLGIEQELPDHLVLKLNYVGRLGRRLIAQADASQLVDFPDTASGQQMSTAFAHMTTELRAGADPTNLPAEPWMEHLVTPGIGSAYGYPNNTSLVGDFWGSLIQAGDFADTVWQLALNQVIDSNVGMASQLSSNTYITNKGFSSYNGLLLTVSKNLSQGLKFDFNYTWSHSIDNVSVVANFIAGGNGYGFLCDARNNRVCRGNSDFDTAQVITSDFIYQLPFGRKRTFAATAPVWVDEVIGGWDISGIPSWSSGQALNTSTEAYVAGFANNAPATFIGTGKGALKNHPHKTSSGAVYLYDDHDKAAAQFQGPVGFAIGNRNFLRGPSSFTFDAGLAKTFPVYSDKVNLKFRADAYNVLNHPVFTTINTDILSGSFGQMTSTSVGARVMQLALRLEF